MEVKVVVLIDLIKPLLRRRAVECNLSPMSPSNAVRSCQVCGKPVEKSSPFDMCPACLGQTKERYDAPKDAAVSAPQKAAAASILALAVCAVIIALRLPAMRRAVNVLHPPAPTATDPADLCLSNLWHVSTLIQEHRWPADDMVCPLTKAPYRTTRITAGRHEDVEVSCPNPRGHGYRALHVSRDHPAPQGVRADAA